MFNKWIFGGIASLIVVSVACVFWYRYDTKPDRQPVTVTQKIVQQSKALPKKDANATIQPKLDHDHSHDDADIHSHVSETSPKTDEYDWRNDNLPNPTPPKKDPWKQIEPTNQTPVDDETYPPRDWHKTEDPELYATYYYAQLLKQFGDIPEVHIIGEHRLNKAKGDPTTLDKFEAYLEAMYSLFPRKENKEALDRLQKLKASDATVYFK